MIDSQTFLFLMQLDKTTGFHPHCTLCAGPLFIAGFTVLLHSSRRDLLEAGSLPIKVTRELLMLRNSNFSRISQWRFSEMNSTLCHLVRMRAGWDPHTRSPAWHHKGQGRLARAWEASPSGQGKSLLGNPNKWKRSLRVESIMVIIPTTSYPVSTGVSRHLFTINLQKCSTKLRERCSQRQMKSAREVCNMEPNGCTLFSSVKPLGCAFPLSGPTAVPGQTSHLNTFHFQRDLSSSPLGVSFYMSRWFSGHR